ncbi:hypothetical protein [Schlesneria sp. T3-172]|uniref:hypothetical protein n=1 Tax=Schlesneria sphaerica TaxID=3373610 RepID=UPI0037C96356
MRDASEYRFLAGERRVTVRAAAPSGAVINLVKAGEDYRDRCELFLNATDTSVSEPARAANGAEVVTVSATLPDGRLKAALLRFGNGPLVELTLTTPHEDSAADAEFDRLLASAKPSHATPAQGVARGLTAADAGTATHPAGPLLLDLSGYTANAEFALETLDGLERYQISRSADHEPVSTKAGLAAPHLAGSTGSGVGSDGRAVQFEMASPRMFAKRVPKAASLELESTLKGASVGRAATSADAVTGTFRGVPLQIHPTGTAATPEKAEQLLRQLENTN